MADYATKTYKIKRGIVIVHEKAAQNFKINRFCCWLSFVFRGIYSERGALRGRFEGAYLEGLCRGVVFLPSFAAASQACFTRFLY